MSSQITVQEIRERMIGQDNRATAHPIFIVQQRRRTYGFDLDYADKVAWIYDGEPLTTDYEELLKFLLDMEMTEDEALAGHLVKTGYQDEWVFVQPFFSFKGAERYIEENAHNLDEPRIYVDSAYRNAEWQAIRRLLTEE